MYKIVLLSLLLLSSLVTATSSATTFQQMEPWEDNHSYRRGDVIRHGRYFYVNISIEQVGEKDGD